MKKTFSLVLCACISLISVAQYNSQNLTIKQDQTVQFTYKNLRLYPIYANQVFLDVNKGLGKYTPLQLALEQKKVVVTETGGTASNVQRSVNQSQQSAGSGATVNTLFIENISSDTIMIMAGEVVRGGQQDRMLAVDMILPPNSGKKDISVFCVEHGRWTSSTPGNTFNGYSKVSCNSVRKQAVVDKSQQGVWSEVADVTGKNGATTGTGTYTALDTSTKYNEELKGYIEFFKAAMQTQGNVIGVVACTGDSVIGCDLFATPEMFAMYFDNLLNSYAADAISNGTTAKTEFATVQNFLDKFLTDESQQEAVVEKKGSILKSNGKKVHMSKF